MRASDIEAVITAQSVLIDALDAGEVLRIEAATAALADLIARAKADDVGKGLDRTRVDHALRQGEAARTRVNFLADRTRQKRERLAEIRGIARPAVYGANGCMTA